MSISEAISSLLVLPIAVSDLVSNNGLVDRNCITVSLLC